MYKIASDFTDFVIETYPNRAKRILDNIDVAINSMFPANQYIEDISLPVVLSKFHSGTGMTISELEDFFAKDFSKHEGRLYKDLETLLSNVETTTETRNAIRAFMKKYQRPAIQTAGPAAPIYRTKGDPKGTTTVPNTPEPDYSLPWQKEEMKNIKTLDKGLKTKSYLIDLLYRFASVFEQVAKEGQQNAVIQRQVSGASQEAPNPSPQTDFME